MDQAQNMYKSEENEIMIPTVAIVGRPNVGKSSLFNAIIGRRLAIVHEASGVTRDRIMAPATWHGKHFQLVDTGGLGTLTGEMRKVDMWDKNIRAQVDVAIEGADVLVFVVNVQDGVVALDKEVADRLRECGKKVILAVNKVDEVRQEALMTDFAELGYDALMPVSSLHRRGIHELMTEALSEFESINEMPEKPEPFRITAIGRPNVGKSSLVNRLLGEDRVMVSEVAGTTRDSVDIDFELEFDGERLPASLVDTAGLRKRAKVSDAVEMFSAMRAQSAIERSDLVLFLVEAKSNGVTAQDRRIAAMIAESGKACIMVANKWDICEERDQEEVMKEIRYTLPGMPYAPVVFVSALQGYNMEALLDTIADVMEQLDIKVPTSMINRAVDDAIQQNSAPVIGRAPLKIYYTTMVSSRPPTFLLFVNNPKYCAANYLAYLRNYFRNAFGFVGLPIVLKLRERPKTIESIRTTKPRPKKKPAGASGDKSKRKSTKPGAHLKGTKAMKARRRAARRKK